MTKRFHPEVQKKIPELISLLRAHKVSKAYLFGSALTNQFDKDSDIDLLVSFQEGLDPVENGELWWSLWYALQDLFNRNVDLITERSIQNPYFREEVREKRVPIYE